MTETKTDNNTRWTLSEYIEKRVDKQQKYHSEKSTSSQNQYKRLKIVEIVAAAIIPVCITLGNESPCLQYLAIILSIIVAIIAGLMTLGSFQSDWTSHRMTSEKLKAEKALLLSRGGPYDKSNATDQELLQLLVENVESILAEESRQWQKKQQQPPKKPVKQQPASNQNV